MGEIELWDEAEASLGKVLTDLGYKYNINEGDGAFYGPKIDIHIKDALNRSHQCATVQLDFQMPEKFDLTYVDEDNQEAQPVMIHRAVFGSLDRFLGILIEHYAGAFAVRKHGSDKIKQMTKLEFMNLVKQQIQEKNHQYY